MESDVRTAVLGVAIAFVALLGALTIGEIADSGLNILTLLSLGLVAMLLIALIGAIRNPPE